MKVIDVTHPRHYEEAAATATDFLMNGGIVLVPTDTAYAVAVDATNKEAVRAVFELKGRHDGNPLSVAVSDRAAAEDLVQFSPESARLWTSFMPGKLTLILPAIPSRLAPDVTAGLGTVGIRQPNHPLAQLISERLGRPFTATSANRAGEPPAFSPSEFLDAVGDDFGTHLVLDAGQLPMGPVSTVVSVVDEVKVLREGGIPKDKILTALE